MINPAVTDSEGARFVKASNALRNAHGDVRTELMTSGRWPALAT